MHVSPLCTPVWLNQIPAAQTHIYIHTLIAHQFHRGTYTRSLSESNSWLLTYELLVPNIQRHVSQSRCDRAHHPVIIHPQQLHQDGQPFLLTHRRPYVCRKLSTKTHQKYVSKLFSGIKGALGWKRTFQLPADRFCRDPAAPSRVAGLELSASSVKYGFTTEGCHSISAPLGHLEKPGMGPTPSH